MDTHIITEDRDIILTRRFAAPRPLVWRAWTDPAMISAWWGPEVFTTTVDMDVRDGGVCNLTMHGPDGAYPIDGTFEEVVENELLVMIFTLDRHPPAWHELIKNAYVEAGGYAESYVSGPIVTRVLFESDGDATQVTVRQHFPNTALRDAHVKLGNGIGWGQSFDKLDKVLEGAQ